MKLVLKIAAGVLLGILAAFLLYLAVEMWEMNNLAKQRAEQQRLDAAMEEARVAREKARISEAVKEIGDFMLLPDEAIERCGQPLRGYRNGDSTSLYYLGADGQTIRVVFECYKGAVPCTRTMERANRSHYQEMHPTEYESFFAIENGKTEADAHWHAASAESQVKELPCLAGAR